MTGPRRALCSALLLAPLAAWGAGAGGQSGRPPFTWTLDDRGWTVLDPGTPVLILGCHAFNARPPWRSPEWLAAGIRMPAEPVTEPYSCR